MGSASHVDGVHNRVCRKSRDPAFFRKGKKRVQQRNVEMRCTYSLSCAEGGRCDEEIRKAEVTLPSSREKRIGVANGRLRLRRLLHMTLCRVAASDCQ